MIDEFDNQFLDMNYDPDEVVKEFEQNIRKYESFEKILKNYIHYLILSAVDKGELDKDSFDLKSRTKTKQSFEGKIKRDDKRRQYKDPIREVTDLVGAKIMLTSLGDANRVYDLLKKDLKEQIDEKNSVNKTKDLWANRKFGYLGRHLVISFDPKMLKSLKDDKLSSKIFESLRLEIQKTLKSLEENHFSSKDFEGLKAEIQIKTLLQHVWAEIEHKARYKAGEELSADKRRYFDRLAALVEVADDLFRDLIKESKKQSKRARKRIKAESSVKDIKELKGIENQKSIELDSASMLVYLKDEGVIAKFKSLEDEYLDIACYDEPDLVSAKFIELARLSEVLYTRDLNELLENKNYALILQEYARYVAQHSRSKKILQKLHILQLLIYIHSNKKEKIKKERLINERSAKILDELVNRLGQ
ncbi:hypothetical protein DMB92_04075 [Campylobacter sp. MIT 99-7217]|uniref:GTP pyrophosphokinase n=1 Tax=Campylobacter sp. MIT 99-7217 TaxID=535091 RepID=UPI00115A41C6|nr:hypothetical protein [Campylobacter sp. MIT 99-7217]TQR33142.1 hypothetical protein DMB92_04075 [Campylobacter sp. MIT 99-7217]